MAFKEHVGCKAPVQRRFLFFYNLQAQTGKPESSSQKVESVQFVGKQCQNPFDYKIPFTQVDLLLCQWSQYTLC